MRFCGGGLCPRLVPGRTLFALTPLGRISAPPGLRRSAAPLTRTRPLPYGVG